MLYRMTTTSPIFGLRREIDRLFEDTFARDGNAWTPAVDIKETENDIRVELELPGMKPEDVEITAENGVLTIGVRSTASARKAKTAATTLSNAPTARSCGPSSSPRESMRNRSTPNSRTEF